jgi:hypothetical protein
MKNSVKLVLVQTYATKQAAEKLAPNKQSVKQHGDGRYYIASKGAKK